MKTQTLPLQEPAPDGRTFVNQSCWYVITEGCVTVFVNGMAMMSYDLDDQTTASLIRILLIESRVATQEEIAEAFAVDRITLYRQRLKYYTGGVEGLIPKKKGPKGPRKTGGKKDKVILQLKKKGNSNRSVAQSFGVSEHTIRTALKRLGYHPPQVAQSQLPLPPEKKAEKEVSSQEPQDENKSPEPEAIEEEKEQGSGEAPKAEVELAAQSSLDPDPSNRIIDRLLARMGLLDDAAPLFQAAKSVQGVGVLLAIPILVAHGVFVDAMKTFSSIGPAFYGVRNAIVTLIFCFLRGINRPENLKEHSPSDMGKVVGLDRVPEMKTLRRKIRDLVKQNSVLRFLKLQLQRHLSRLTKKLLWVYVDGHVSVYSGKRKLSKHYVTRLRISLPSVLDYWVNDQRGDPLLVLTGKPRKGMVGVLEEVVYQLRDLGEKRIITLVFDREGWSPALFARLEAMDGIRFVTYRKAKKGRKLPRLPASEFRKHTHEIDDEKIEYELAQRQVYIDYGRGKKKKRLTLRQVTRRTEDGHQTHVITNDWDTSEIEIAYRMFDRWSQENFFKYMRQHKDLDGLITYFMQEADPERLVANPRRKALKEELKRHREELEKLMSKYGEHALNNHEAFIPTMRGFKISNGSLGQEIKKENQIIEKLKARLKQIPAKIPVHLTMPDDSPKKVHTQTRQLVHAFHMVVYRAETALRELIRDVYPRWREESRTLIRMFLNSTGDIIVADGKLRVTFDKQSAPHRTKLLALICNELNSQKAKFPGSDLVLHFEVRGVENVAQSD